MTLQISLLLLILFLSLGMGGGLYETLAVYPNWKANPTPQGLAQKLTESGQALAGRRFWPLISPMTALLALLNLFLAWRETDLLRTVWLTAAILIIVKSLATYAYFVPTMIRKIAKPANMAPEELTKTVRLWTRLSPLRLCFEFAAWSAAIWAWTLLARA